MRLARLKPESANPAAPSRPAGTYYHLVNRISGQPGEFPFGDPEKQKPLGMLLRLCLLFVIQPISCAVMGNHFHLVVFVPALPPVFAEALRHFRAFYGEKRVLGGAEVQRLPGKLRDISAFMHMLEFPFTCWFNATRPGGRRRGTLWQGRFKSVILSPEATRRCITYVELNAVRAKIATSPSEYRFCSFGIWEATGSHPFGKAVLDHLRYLLGPEFKEAGAAGLRNHLRGEFARIAAGEAGLDCPETEEARRGARVEPALAERLSRRVRHWSDGLIVGSRIFVMETAAARRDKLAPFRPERLEVHRLGRLAGTEPAPDTAVFSWRNLQKGVT